MYMQVKVEKCQTPRAFRVKPGLAPPPASLPCLLPSMEAGPSQFWPFTQAPSFSTPPFLCHSAAPGRKPFWRPAQVSFLPGTPSVQPVLSCRSALILGTAFRVPVRALAVLSCNLPRSRYPYYAEWGCPGGGCWASSISVSPVPSPAPVCG